MKSLKEGGKYTVIRTSEVEAWDNLHAKLFQRLEDARKALKIIANNTTDPDAGKMAAAIYIATDEVPDQAVQAMAKRATERLLSNWDDDGDLSDEHKRQLDATTNAIQRGLDR